MRIGVLGGTFDPVHNAHLFVAEDAAARLRLAYVLIIPNAIPPHKQGHVVTPAEHRLRMVELAVVGSTVLRADPLEIERGGPSYTVETLRVLKARQPGVEIVYLAGADAVAEIGTWREPAEVVRLCRMCAVTRPGFDIAALRTSVPPDLLAFIEFHAVPELGISSTMIRERCRLGLPIRHLTPDAVVRYIDEHGLYRG